METLKGILLAIHIVSGFAALFIGVLAIILKKGNRQHRIYGMIFFVSMMLVCVTALSISAMTSNVFLFTVGVFTFTQVYFGKRAVKNKIQKASLADLSVLLLGLMNVAIMAITLNVVLLVFATISLIQLFTQSKFFYLVWSGKEIPSNTWLVQHVGLMLGSYIATLTAFLVVNLQFIKPEWLVWITPSILGGSLIAYFTGKIKKQPLQPKATLIGLLLFFCLDLTAQVYVEGGNTRHRFAQLNLGADYRIYTGKPNHTYQYSSDGILQKINLGNQHEMRFIIGGTHFWGHADFFVAIPVWDISKTGFSGNIETGARYYPWRIEKNKFRPYIGTSLMPVNFKQGEGTTLVRTKAPLNLGFTFNYKNHLLDFGFTWNYKNSNQYYFSTTDRADFAAPPFAFTLGYKFILETTLSAEKDWQSGRTAEITEHLAKEKKLNGFTIAAGPSSAFFTRASAHNQIFKPFIDDHKGIAVFGDFGLGYYWHQPDLQINFSWRSYESEINAYNYSQTASRKSLGFEVFKFISDYHGFAAFIGPIISYEWLDVTDKYEANIEFTGSFKGIKPGITFGWDIRPNRLQQIVLRTNLRYYPFMNVNMTSGEKFSFDQLEFNFIQVVIYPGRIF